MENFIALVISLLLLVLPYSVLRPVKSYAEEISRSQFPDGFVFGAATSSYQIEGAFLEDGKSLNNWDVFSHVPGNIEGGDNGDVALDHYHRYLEDIELIHSLGVNAYRFSISWARILPRGRTGAINTAALMFYNNIIDHLLLKGIEPFVTINHLEIPQVLEDRYGGFLSPLVQEDFVHFAEVCFKKFGDRVKYWITINEPNVFAELGYLWGTYPPGHCSAPFGNCSIGNSEREPLVVVHNMLLSHAKAVHLYRKHYQPKQGGCIGLVVHSFMYEPLTDQELDHEAALRALAFDVAWVLDPLLKGDYPLEMHNFLGSDLPKFSPSESNNLKDSIDFIGINHYSTLYAKDCIYSPCQSGNNAIQGFVYRTGERDGVPIGEKTAMPKNFVVPSGLEKLINYLKTRYNNKPMFVTENGLSQKNDPKDGQQELLHDVKRVEYHKGYLASIARAIRNGADVRGYFVWSLFDNFEWIYGYSVRFGLYYVDFLTLERIPKLSARWYTNFLASSNHNNVNGSVRNAPIKENSVAQI
ncbi:beta-glucosidase 18-like [Malania oleifera]|uniref:beta-glucosidase 18-like n=1 Tax=Malania oleifera TaxID=397392 RepID=UPI0025ADA6E3|nr:beta-glucosidase 18-like [Malania oleifera]